MQGSSRSKRLGWHLLLALLMLLMQHGALRHAFAQHAANEDGHPAHSTLCKECLAFAAIDAVAPSTATVLTLPLAFAGQPEQGSAQRHVAASLAYQSRAPPPLSVTA